MKWHVKEPRFERKRCKSTCWMCGIVDEMKNVIKVLGSCQRHFRLFCVSKLEKDIPDINVVFLFFEIITSLLIRHTQTHNSFIYSNLIQAIRTPLDFYFGA